MEFKFPDTGEGVTEGQFLEWKISEGDKVDEDQIVGEAETDKAVVDIPAPSDGTVKELRASPGDMVKVGDVIMILDTDTTTEVEKESKKTDKTKSDEKVDTSAKNNSSEHNSNSSGQVDAVMGGSPSASSYDDKENKENSGSEQDSSRENSSKSSNSSEDVLAMPRVRKQAREEGINLSQLDVDGKITLDDLEDSDTEQDENKISKPEKNVEKTENSDESSKSVDVSKDVNATPSVRRLAREHHIELSMIDGSGKGGKITREDVLTAAGEDKEESPTDKTTHSEDDLKNNNLEKNKVSTSEAEEFSGDVERIPLSGMRKAIGDKMTKSRFTAPHVTHVEKVDITELVELRESVKGEVDAHITYLPFIMKALVSSLKRHPDLNAVLDEENSEIIRKKFYDFNIAVDTERGLLVPKIDNVNDKNLVELAESISEKVKKSQDNNLSRDEMSNGTFSITNLGVIGGRAFTPIINYPQIAILGIGRIEETAEVVDGEIVPRNTVKLSLSYDHRVVDGAEAAKFMNKIKENLENPRELILEL